MSSQTELLLALVNELPYVQSLLSDIKQLKKDVKYEKNKQKNGKKHSALLNILHDYPSLMHHQVKQEVIDLTNEEETIAEVSSIKISYDPVQIKEENITREDDDLSVEEESKEIQIDENEVKETLSIENNYKEEVVFEQEESEEDEVEIVEESEEEEVEIVEESEEDEVEIVEESEEEEVEVVEESEEEEQEEEEEDEELFEMEIGGKTYFVTDEKNGTIYEALDDDDIGEMLGHLKDGTAVWNKKVKKTKK